jgi:hypothetical protein
MREKRITKRGNYRNVANLCPNCFSTLQQDAQGKTICSGDRLSTWQAEFEKYQNLTEDQKADYLDKLGNPEKFLELTGSLSAVDCGYSSKISHVAPTHSIRIPDPIAVRSLERKLQRNLTEEELDEEYEFLVEGKLFKLPFCQFPEEM